MLDMKWIREHADEVQTAAERKGIEVSIGELLARDEEKRKLKRETDTLRERRNRLSGEIGRLILERRTEEAEPLRTEMKDVNGRLAELEGELRETEESFTSLFEKVPNVVSLDTPIGHSDEDNVELKRIGEPPIFAFAARDHIELGELHGLIDVPRGVKTAGSRHYYLTS